MIQGMLSVLFSAQVAMAAMVSGPQAVVQEIFAKTSVDLISTNLQKQEEVNAFVDFSTLAESALGKEKKKILPKEVQWFKDALKEIITRSVYPKAPSFLKDVKINYQSVEEVGSTAIVKSVVQNKADLTEVNYKLAKIDSGGWKVVDVSISGLSWVESISSQVKEVVQKKKWKGLKDAMNKRLATLRAGNK